MFCEGTVPDFGDCPRTWSKGFTLIEAVLAIGLVAIGLVGVMIAFQGAARNAILADQTVAATNLARGALEHVITQRDAGGYTATLSSITGGSYNEASIVGLTGYALTVSASEVNPDVDPGTDDFLDAAPGSGVARVTALVSWNSGRSSIQLVTLIAQYTL